ncbi:MAG TPA: tyrosine-type recombinase/integrase [Anaeromyxobacteraceae bacterium]|nr:tyrosine-type recombinase/integrase [Anaeromyxobacteraceae bacterium]
MSVRLRKWKTKAGKVLERWTIDVKVALPGQPPRRIRDFSPVNTRRGAEQHERLVRAALLSGTLDKEVKEVPTLEAFQDRFLDYAVVNNKPSTVFQKRWVLRLHIVPVFGRRRLDAIGPAEIEAYKARKLREGQAAKSVNNHLYVLRKLLNLAVEWGELSHAPRVKQLRVPHGDFQFLTFEETERFLRAAAPEWKPFVTTALKTGLRVGELLALRWEDLDLVAGRLVVRRTLWQDQEGTPKGGRIREVPLSDEAVATLQAHRHLRGPYVFCEPDGRRLNHNRVKQVVPRTCARAGLAKRLTTHDLRHTFASHLVMRGVALKAVQELLGHATIDMTMRYAHLSPDVKRDAVQLLDRPAPARSADSPAITPGSTP